MFRRVVSLSIIASLALYAVAARAQESAPVTRAEFNKLVKSIDDLTAQIQSLKTPAAPPEAAAAVPSPPAGREAALAQRVAELEKQVADLQAAKKELVDIASNHSVMLGQIAQGHIAPDGEKRYVPSIQAIRDDTAARRELVDTVVQGMARPSGELKIVNRMGTGQSLLINGLMTVYIPANATQTVTVPAGTATTKLATETTKSWMIGAPNYSQEIVIAPAPVVNPPLVTWQDPATGILYTTVQ